MITCNDKLHALLGPIELIVHQSTSITFLQDLNIEIHNATISP